MIEENSVLMGGSLFLLCFLAFVAAYYIYGRYLARRIFRIDPAAQCPSAALRDEVNFVPTDRHILFAHHFTSIAGLTPILSPAVAIIWGWLPAVLWVVFGSIFLGSVHDFGALVLRKALREKNSAAQTPGAN